jgi:glucose repression mediator protein
MNFSRMRAILTVVVLGSFTELMGDLDRAMQAFEAALRMNPYSIPAMNSISCILRTKEQFPKAVEYLQSILNMDNTNGEIWGSLGHCYLMMDDLQKAYQAYQQALYHLRDPKVRHRCSLSPYINADMLRVP